MLRSYSYLDEYELRVCSCDTRAVWSGAIAVLHCEWYHYSGSQVVMELSKSMAMASGIWTSFANVSILIVLVVFCVPTSLLTDVSEIVWIDLKYNPNAHIPKKWMPKIVTPVSYSHYIPKYKYSYQIHILPAYICKKTYTNPVCKMGRILDTKAIQVPHWFELWTLKPHTILSCSPWLSSLEAHEVLRFELLT